MITSHTRYGCGLTCIATHTHYTHQMLPIEKKSLTTTLMIIWCLKLFKIPNQPTLLTSADLLNDFTDCHGASLSSTWRRLSVIGRAIFNLQSLSVMLDFYNNLADLKPWSEFSMYVTLCNIEMRAANAKTLFLEAVMKKHQKDPHQRQTASLRCLKSIPRH